VKLFELVSDSLKLFIIVSNGFETTQTQKRRSHPSTGPGAQKPRNAVAIQTGVSYRNSETA